LGSKFHPEENLQVPSDISYFIGFSPQGIEAKNCSKFSFLLLSHSALSPDYFDFLYKFSSLQLSRSSHNAKAQPQSLNII